MEAILRENEEFLNTFDLCREDLMNQVQSILFQHETLTKLAAKVDELSRLDISQVLQHAFSKPTTEAG
jgi:hypothetical protein